MSAAVELAEGNIFVDGLQGQSATRVFYNTGSTSGLPALGSLHPESSTGLILTEITRSPLDGSPTGTGTGTKHQFVCSYGPQDADSIDENAAFSELPRRLEMGGELLRIPNENKSDGSKWHWNTTPAKFIEKNIDIVKIIPTGSLILTDVVTSMSTLRPKIIARQGRLNTTTFENFEAGTLLYMGASAEEFINNSGSKRWRVSHVFQYRLPTGTSGAGQDGWNYSYRGGGQGNNGWDRPQDINNNFLYLSTTFSGLF